MTEKGTLVLRTAREMLADPSAWTKGAHRTYGYDGVVVCRCLIGALSDAAAVHHDGDYTGYSEAAERIRDAIYLRENKAPDNLAWWNDDPVRTHADVVSVIDSAIGADA